jgi:Flp pilus assembly protein TadD
LEIDPTHLETLINLGVIYSKREMLDDAENCFRQAIAVAPTAAYAYNNLGGTHSIHQSNTITIDHH